MTSPERHNPHELYWGMAKFFQSKFINGNGYQVDEAEIERLGLSLSWTKKGLSVEKPVGHKTC
jgi:hypothetical protein